LGITGFYELKSHWRASLRRSAALPAAAAEVQVLTCLRLLAIKHRQLEVSQNQNNDYRQQTTWKHGLSYYRLLNISSVPLTQPELREIRPVFSFQRYVERRLATTTTDCQRAAEAYMNLGNVTSFKVNDQYLRQAMAYLQEAAERSDYSLPAHLEQ
jgi:hypothetical protein